MQNHTYIHTYERGNVAEFPGIKLFGASAERDTASGNLKPENRVNGPRSGPPPLPPLPPRPNLRIFPKHFSYCLSDQT